MFKFRKEKMAANPIIRMVRPTSKDESRFSAKAPDFAYSFRPFYYFSRMVGLMPFSIIYDTNGQIQGPKARLYDVVWFVISMCVYLFIVYNSYGGTQFTSDGMMPTILTLAESFQTIVCTISELVTIAMDMYNRRRMIDILKMFNAFDKEVYSYYKSMILIIL